MPKVSVILPNYNYARYLKERVRSILHQDFADFELIYLDDGSSDASHEVMQTFQGEPRLRMIEHTQNSGRVYQRWNEGAREACGDWLWFAGADDAAQPQFLSKMMELAERYPRAAILYGLQEGMDGDGRLLRSTRSMPIAPSLYSSGSAEELVLSLMRSNFLESASSMLLRRDVFEALGGFDVRLWLAADWHLYLSMLERHDIAFLNEPLVTYRYHAATVTKSTKMAVILVENAYCVAHAAAWIQRHAGCSASTRHAALRMAQVRVFDLFADPNLTIPEDVKFALAAVHEVVPDRRLVAGS